MVRQLVINADDLGLTRGVNDGIFDAHACGVLTSASLFANAPATDDAIRRLRAHRSLGVGAHLALVDGTPVLPPSEIPTLVGRDGRFRPSWKPFVVACVCGQVSMRDVERELAAQIERLQRSAIVLTHLDAHKHVHAYPPIFDIVLRLGARFGVPVVRVPYERTSPFRASSGQLRRQAWLNAAMWPWAHRNRRAARAVGIRTPAFIGRVHTGLLDRAGLHALVDRIGPGVTELIVHPGYLDNELRQTGTRLLQSRQQELELLCRMDTSARLASERIELIRHDLAHSLRRAFRHVS